MKKSVFIIRQMDCPSEETMIRMRLEGVAEIHDLQFDIPNRQLTVLHNGNLDSIKASIDSLNFGSSLLSTDDVSADALRKKQSDRKQSRLLWSVLLINFGFFLLEMISGIISRSMGLIADSLDMLADTIVYGLSLFAVGTTVHRKKQVAGISGYLQLALALGGIVEVVRRFIGNEGIPHFQTMIVISVLALIGNSICLYLLQKSKSDEAHMKASMIFTSNDVIVNLGVIVSGILVFVLDSKIPDLAIGAIVFLLVTRGAVAILKLSK